MKATERRERGSAGQDQSDVMKTRGNPPGNAALRSGSPAPANTEIGVPGGKHRGAAVKKEWPVTRLGDLTDLVTKGTTPTSIGHEFVEDGINFVKVESITTTGEFIEEKFAHITPACHAVLKRSQLQAGDILFSIAGALGRTGFVTDEILPANTNQALAIIRLKRDIGLSSKFVLKALETGLVLEQIEKFKGGVAQQNLSLAQVRDFQIAFPPLPEQQRIVGLLDEAFAGLATAKANAEKNLQNARAVFESHLQSVFTQRGPGWVEKTLADCFRLKSGDNLTSKTMKSGEYPVYGGNNIAGMHDEFNLSGDNVIIGRVGALCGNARHITEKIWLTDNAFRVVDLIYTFDNAFLTYLLNYKNLRSLARQAAQPVISNSSLKDLVLNFPGFPEQKRITKQLDALHKETQRLAHLYEKKLAALEALKKSLLHQAFSGEL